MKEKLVKQFLTDQKHITVEDCDRLLPKYGFQYRKSSGSHRAYHKKGERPIIIITPKHTKYIKPEYIKEVVKRLSLED
ncbi:MAG: type II toxin-antitoxin system HicA family toxin [Dehalococcoidales bacterium]|nr:type II toxin-antitoxin system HicA family toxin [Dehalococcoidales bacterium]